MGQIVLESNLFGVPDKIITAGLFAEYARLAVVEP
jgi:hypothetical protein